MKLRILCEADVHQAVTMAEAIQDSVQKNLTSLQRRMITVGVLGLLIILVLLGVWLGSPGAPARVAGQRRS